MRKAQTGRARVRVAQKGEDRRRRFRVAHQRARQAGGERAGQCSKRCKRPDTTVI